MREAIGIGETVELAKEAACQELGVESYEAEFEILEMPTKKTFGLFGGSPAKVRVYLEDDPAEAAAKYLRGVLSCMGVANVEVSIRKEEGGAILTVSGDDVGFIIGHRGETLDALQYLAGLVANHIGSGYYRIAVDVGNYREKRRETLEALGKKMAEKSLRLGRNTSLEPMNPYERRIIHTAVQTVEGAKSWSEGEDLERHVVIGPIAGERYPRRQNPANHGRGGKRPMGQHHGRPPIRPQQKKQAAELTASPQRQQEPRPRKSDYNGALYGKIDKKQQ
jgi:spoIIIJ-associated protein